MKGDKSKHKTTEPVVKSDNLFPVVGIGASAGGLDAFKKLLKAIPEDSGMAYVLVQHLDPSHESMLPELLQKVTNIPVLEIADDIKVEPNHIYVLPSNKIMVASDGILLLAPRPPKSKNERNLPIDLFFTSLAEVHQAHAIGVVLSGTATDGTLGLKAIKGHGGITFAQDEASAAYEGMPHSAAQAGVVDFILPPEKIPKKLLEVMRITNGIDSHEQNTPLQDEELFKNMLSLLRIRKGTDFTYYKQTTIRRRILRRMALNKNEEPAAYLKYLRENKTEQDVLYQDLLIPVTTFFRDSKSFDNLCETVFPLIVKNKEVGEPIRVWVAGCSTGEEAYSVAMCLKEFLGENQEKIQIFATDISEPAIAKARMGIYSKNDVDAVTPQRLSEFFTKTNGSYQVNKNVRDMCVFAIHNFLKDPPFGRMDFISCRNVLIYMEPYLQKKALTTFHYSLNPKGYLLLGKSETTSGVPDFFESAIKNDKIFSRKDVPGRFIQVASQRSEITLSHTDAGTKSENIRTDFQKTADDILLSRYTPAGVVVNEAMDIVNFRGSTGNYLEQSPGKPTHNLLKMAKQGLAFELRNILHKAKKDKISVLKENIPLQINDSLRSISIEAIPLPNTIEPYYLILFHDNNSLGNKPTPLSKKRISNSKAEQDDKDLRIQQLEQELAQIREDMRSITEEQEAANEELQSANEELLSGSEELQSLNEELETNKEELQSTNEELTVVNHEVINLNEQVTEARDYAESIIATMHEPLIILDKNLRIKTANQAFFKTFDIKEEDAHGVLLYDLGNKQWNIPRLRELLENVIPKNSHFQNFELTHNFSSLGEKTMLLNASRLVQKSQGEQLILMAMFDITEQKRVENELINASTFAEKATKIATEAQNNAESATLVAEDAVKAKQQFLSNMSHEIRTPMNAIIGFTHIVLKTELNDKQKEYINAIKISGDALIILINDILDLAKVDAGKMTFEQTPFDLSVAISTMLQLFEAKIKEKNLVLTKEYDDSIPTILLGDPMRLRQIILNLMSNAVKFTKEGKINMRVHQLKEDAESITVEFALSDTGIGIPNNKLSQIFLNFEQASKDTSSYYGGTGLGLAIVKQLVELQGGTINVKSELGKGSTFSFILSFQKSDIIPEIEKKADKTIEIEKKAESETKIVKVLVAEDMTLNQLLIKLIVLEFGFEIDIVANGKLAIEKLQNNHYDIILMDLQMPEMDGFEATTYIRNNLKSPIPIIALTADVTSTDVERCKTVGMNDYISKPIDEKLLYSKMIKCLENA